MENLTDAAGEFVDKLNPAEDADVNEEEGSRESSEGATNTMDVRQKKLEQLRARMVSRTSPLLAPVWYHDHNMLRGYRGHRRKRTAPPLLKRRRRPS